MRWHGVHYKTGEAFEIVVEGRQVRVQATGTRQELGDGGPRPGERFLAPGLIDLQLNGFAGVDLNQPDELTQEGIAKVVAAQRALGVTHFLPTVTTNSAEHIAKAMRLLAHARQDPDLGASMPGIHLEGPYFSPEDGPRGAHPREHVRPPDWDEFQRWQEAAEGGIRLVTLSPEYPESPDFIRRLVNSGVAAAIGHTGASPEQIRQAIDAGATLSTHLGNGSHALIRRHPNYIWEQMAADELHATLIVDGHHLPPSVVKCMVRSKEPQRVILISDAVSVAGLPPGRYRTLTAEVELTTDGAVRLAGTPYLAGAALELPQAIVNTSAWAGVPFATAVEMASLHPARYLAQHAGTTVRVGFDGDAPSFTLFERTPSGLRALLTVVDGIAVYQAE